MRATGVVVTGALLIAAACGREAVPVEGEKGAPPPIEAAPPAQGIVAADTAFTLDLFKAIAADEDGNVVLSPHGVDAVLSMVLAGAKGKTADELNAVLHHGASPADIADFGKLQSTLRSRQGKEVELELTASSWLDKGIDVRPQFKQAIESGFGAVPHVVDFANDSEAARKAINADVSKVTRKHIPELLKNRFGADTFLVLVSAAYLKAKWADPFEKDDTSDRPFTMIDGSTKQVSTMSATRRLPTAEAEGWRAAELPYMGESLAMTVIVPDDIRAFEKSLSPDVLNEVVGSLAPELLELTMPKFEFRTAKSLKAPLDSMGARAMFTFTDDFAGIVPPPRQLRVSEVQHEAWVKVDEEGTEAAAATAAVMEVSSAPVIKPFPIDRPFLFLIRDKPTGAILFLGRVANPAAN